jgi:hypothetical protein
MDTSGKLYPTLRHATPPLGPKLSHLVPMAFCSRTLLCLAQLQGAHERLRATGHWVDAKICCRGTVNCPGPPCASLRKTYAN